METKLSEIHFNKDTFSRMTVSLAIQLLSSSVVTMFKKATNDITIIPDICLKLLAWFNKWHDKVNSIENNTNSFLPIQSWKILQSLVLGLVGLIQMNVKTIVPRTTNTDGIENHFNCLGQNGGRGDTPTAQEQQTNDTRASAFTITAGPSKGIMLLFQRY